MKIATFNVNGINSRLDRLLEWLAESKPDVACLQELKSPDANLPLDAIRGAGYGIVAHGQRAWNGVAILARGKEPIDTGRGLPGMPADPQSRYIEAVVDGVLIGCLYLPNGNPQPGPKFDYKLQWFDAFNRHAKKLFASGLPVVLAGDYNVVPTDADIYNPASWRDDALLQPESRAAFAQLLKQGWTDAIRASHPGRVPFTFWTYWRNRYPRDAGLRIDHLLLNAELAPMLRSAGVDHDVRGRTGASDHAPAWIELDIPKA
jgi:exodeoxyribonuclease-3